MILQIIYEYNLIVKLLGLPLPLIWNMASLYKNDKQLEESKRELNGGLMLTMNVSAGDTFTLRADRIYSKYYYIKFFADYNEKL